ncbi:MAG: sulfatase [Planctomycetota bacterium]
MRRCTLILLVIIFSAGHSTFASGDVSRDRPDVLLIAIDDLNDWVGCLGGHPDAKTPHIDRLAARGTLFTNAHCQSPVCNPSRASMMTSLYPETTGIYFLNPPIASAPVAQDATPLTVRFSQDGYLVRGAGKLYHNRENTQYISEYAGAFGGFGPIPSKKLSPFPGHPLWDWGVYPERDEQMPDHKIASWATAQLGEAPEGPRMLCIGFYRPHVPQYTPQRWFDLHADSALRPQVRDDDLADLSSYAIDLTREEHVAPTHDWVVQEQQWEPLVLSYLASLSFVDAQVGRVLDALDASGRADRTIIVLYSDHGFHLGEKDRWAKRSIWEDGVRVPVVVVAPGTQAGQVCTKPVELIDLYPTLLDLAGLEPDAMHEGQSLVPLLEDADADWPHMARSSFGPGNVAIRSEHFRYIRYNDGSEEFYDHRRDPHEWDNRIADPAYTDAIATHREHLPQSYHAVLGQNSTGHKAYAAAEQNREPAGR